MAKRSGARAQTERSKSKEVPKGDPILIMMEKLAEKEFMLCRTRLERLRRVLDSAGGEALKVAGEERFEMRSLPNLHEMRSTLPVGIKYNRIDEGLILKKQLGRYQFESRLATLGA